MVLFKYTTRLLVIYSVKEIVIFKGKINKESIIQIGYLCITPR